MYHTRFTNKRRRRLAKCIGSHNADDDITRSPFSILNEELGRLSVHLYRGPTTPYKSTSSRPLTRLHQSPVSVLCRVLVQIVRVASSSRTKNLHITCNRERKKNNNTIWSRLCVLSSIRYATPKIIYILPNVSVVYPNTRNIDFHLSLFSFLRVSLSPFFRPPPPIPPKIRTLCTKNTNARKRTLRREN